MSYVPHIDEMACLAHGDCIDAAPNVFELEDIAVVVGSDTPEVILKAAAACPAVAITVIDSDTGEQVYP